MTKIFKSSQKSSYPVSILEGSNQEMDQSGNSSVLSERGMIGGAQRKIADQTNHRLHQGPTGWRVHEADNSWQTALQADSVLGHLAFWVAGG